MDLSFDITAEFRRCCPQYAAGILCCEISNSQYDADLWQMIDGRCVYYQTNSSFEEIKKMASISATRRAYKATGKEPDRYRPSAEALLRRVVKGESLYQINTAGDIINYVSLSSGYSIGGFDVSKIAGTSLCLGIGRELEPYQAIGRGQLNIAGLPVWRDALGGVGTPTSDEVRTQLELETNRLLMIVNAFQGRDGLSDFLENCTILLRRFLFAQNCYTTIYE